MLHWLFNIGSSDHYSVIIVLMMVLVTALFGASCALGIYLDRKHNYSIHTYYSPDSSE